MRRSSDAWILLGLFVLLVVGSYLVSSPDPPKESKAPTSYNADPEGTRAFYTLLGRLGHSMGRLRQPYTEIPAGTKLLIVVAPGERETADGGKAGREISEDERGALEGWVRDGGSVMFVSDDLRGVPWRFRKNGPLGKGQVRVLSSQEAINNRGMRTEGSAEAVYEIVSGLVSKPGLILFDEYHHGLSEDRSLLHSMSRQVKWAAALLLAAGLVLCYSRGRRFGAVRSLPTSQDQRPGFEFVEAVGRLYRRARATDVAAGILFESFMRGLCAKLGIDASAPGSEVLRRMRGDFDASVCERTEALFQRYERSQAGVRPTESELVDMAVEIRSLEKELGIGAVDV